MLFFFYFFPLFVSGVGGFWKVQKIPHFFFWNLPLAAKYFGFSSEISFN